MEKLLWVDLETEGLYPHPPTGHRIFEFGMAITDLNLKKLDEAAWQVWYPNFEPSECDEFIQNMHTKNGLFIDMKGKGLYLEDLSREVLGTLDLWDVPLDRTMPVHGNSLRLDREFISVHLPELDSKLSYRIVDVSSFKETCRRFKPDLYAAYLDFYPDDDKAHRVLSDIDHSISEYKFYLEGMGWL